MIRNFYIRWFFLILIVIFNISNIIFSQCYQLVWSDEFDYTGLPDSLKWTFETGGHGWGNNELQYYTDRIDNAEVKDDILIITAKEESYEGNDYTSARIITYYNDHSWQYGKIEARMKLPYGQGIWPAFWMLGNGIFEGPGWPACGEIDIMEMIGGTNNDNTIHGTVHWDSDGSHAMYGTGYTLDSGIFADDFHVFSVEWDENEIVWEMDDIQYHVIDITPAGLSEFHNDFFIILNLAVGGNWPGIPDETTVFPQTLEVDYVRVYSTSDYLKINGKNEVVKGESNLTYSVIYDEDYIYNWSVPEGVIILGESDSSAIQVNWGCNSGSIECAITTNCGDYTAVKEIDVVNNSITGAFFLQDTEMQFKVSEVEGASYTWEVPNGIIMSGQGTNSIIADLTSEGQISVIIQSTCGIDTVSKYIYAFGKLPYPNPDQPHILPGTITATEYDYGGEGLAYHDIEADNQGPGPRQDEGVDTEYNDNGQPNVGWIISGEWLEYTIKVDKPGTYYVYARVATNNTSGGPFNVLINNEIKLTSETITNTGAWDAFEKIYLGEIEIFDTDTTLKLDFETGGFNISSIVFSDEEPIIERIEVKEQHNDYFIYPNPANDYISIQGIEEIYSYSIFDISGRKIINQKNTGNTINISHLRKGIYFVLFTSEQKYYVYRKFMKN